MRFDPSDGDDYIELPSNSELDNLQEGDYSLSVWVKPATVPPGTVSDNDAQYGLVVKNGYHLGLFYCNDQTFRMKHWLSSNTEVEAASSVCSPDQWYHVVGVVDKQAGETRIYINGNLESTTTWPSIQDAREYGAIPWRIGIGWPDASVYRNAADADIDEVKLYSRALTASEIQNLAN